MRQKIVEIIKANKALFKVAWLFKNPPVKQSLIKQINGKHNQISHPVTIKFNNCEIFIKGHNNIISIGDMCYFNNVMFHIEGNNNRINIGKKVSFDKKGNVIIQDNNIAINIGDQTTFLGAQLAATEAGCEINIGTGCLFADHIDVRTGDSHSVIDSITNKRINYGKSVNIGNHVWVSAHCSILKGVTINNDCIVATRSVVTKSFDKSGCIIGSSPCKILKENITWSQELIK